MDILVEAHSVIRWLVLLSMVVTIGFAVRGMSSGTWDADSLRPARVSAMVFDLQVLLGIILYVGDKGWEKEPFIARWHLPGMLVALGIYHMAIARARKSGDASGHRMLVIGTVLVLVVVIAFIPWGRVAA